MPAETTPRRQQTTVAESSAYVRRVKQLAKPLAPRLGQLDVELTERCNSDCIHCCINRPANDADARRRETTTGQVKEILHQAADLGCLEVRLTGGEPLLRPDFEELYIFARRLGLRVLLFTNGRLITPHLAGLFARIPPLVTIEITVYGMRAESYEAVTRAPGSFAQFWRGVNLLLEHDVPFVVKSAPLPQNKHEMEEFEAWARTIPWMDGLPGSTVFFDLRARRDSEEKNRCIRGLRWSPEDGLAAITRKPEAYRAEMSEFCSKFMSPPGDRLFTCGAGHGACVDAYGRAQLCMLLRHPDTVYDLNSGSLEEALTEFFPRILKTKAEDIDYLSRCARCFLKGLCEQCPAKAWMEHGTLDTPVAYLCAVAHAQARYLGLLEDGECAWDVGDWRERILALQSRTACHGTNANNE